eukprot:1992316-Amphidinium_carterae.1
MPQELGTPGYGQYVAYFMVASVIFWMLQVLWTTCYPNLARSLVSNGATVVRTNQMAVVCSSAHPRLAWFFPDRPIMIAPLMSNSFKKQNEQKNLRHTRKANAWTRSCGSQRCKNPGNTSQCPPP